MTGGRGVLWLAVVAASVLTLTACTDNPPDPTPTTSISAQPTTPTPTVADPPAKPSPTKSASGAVSFVRYFWATYNYAYLTGDTDPLVSVSTSSCGFCSTIHKDVDETVSAKSRITGYEVTVRQSTVPPEKITTGTLVVSSISQQPGTSTGPDGQAHALKGFRSVRSTIALAWDSASGWQVEAVTNDPKTRVDW